MQRVGEKNRWTEFTVERSEEGRGGILRFRRSCLRDAGAIRRLEEEFALLADDLADGLLVVSFAGVEDAPTAVLGLTLQLATDARRRGATVRVSDLHPALARFFDLLASSRLVAMHPTAEEAIRSPLPGGGAAD